MVVALVAFREAEGLEDVAHREIVTGVECAQGGVDDALVLAGEALRHQFGQLGYLEIEHAGQQTEGENVFALVFGGAADGLDGQRGDRHRQMAVGLFGLGGGGDVRGIIQDDAALAQAVDMAVVGVLVERDEQIGLVTGAEDLAGPDAHLENGRSAGDGGGNGHEGHDFLLAASGQTCQEPADGLNAVLRIACDADDRLGDA